MTTNRNVKERKKEKRFRERDRLTK
jgi:hypothetical protein